MSPPYRTETWAALQARKAEAFFISQDVFSVVWALALAGVGAWDMAATFGGIHFPP